MKVWLSRRTLSLTLPRPLANGWAGTAGPGLQNRSRSPTRMHANRQRQTLDFSERTPLHSRKTENDYSTKGGRRAEEAFGGEKHSRHSSEIDAPGLMSPPATSQNGPRESQYAVKRPTVEQQTIEYASRYPTLRQACPSRDHTYVPLAASPRLRPHPQPTGELISLCS